MKKILIVMLTLLLLPPGAVAASSSFKAVDDGVRRQVLAKSGVSENDLSLYREIFAALDKGDTKKAEDLQKKLKTTALNGHLLAEKYLRTDYPSTYEELQAWLKKYPYLPQYPQIKSLAVVKAPGYKPPKPGKTEKKLYASYDWYRDGYKNLKPADRAFVKEINDEFLLAIRKSRLKKAGRILEDARFRKVMPVKNYDAMQATLASAYFLEGDYQYTLKWSRQPIMRSSDATACWFGGLAAWKEKDYQLAADYFERLGKLENNDEWLIAAGAYWAYRANIRLKNPDGATRNLRRATAYPRTFYGILARYMLTDKVAFDWRQTGYYNRTDGHSHIKEIVSAPTMRRALLLIFAGRPDLAERDLRYNYRKFNIRQKELLMFIAAQYSLPNLSLVAAGRLKNYAKGRAYDAFMYPLPDWEPAKGWQVNPAWIWALVRQESLFSPSVQSHAGACGLMQIMPATAAETTGDGSFKKNSRPLFDKDINLAIGQDYVSLLREKDFVGDNLIFLAASYNGGPHNLKRWVNNLDYDGDPLMFMEMIPWKETRLYVKRVITNYWIYSSRLGQKPQSLMQFLQGKWPLLDGIDQRAPA